MASPAPGGWMGSPPTAGPRKGPLAPSGLMSPLDGGRVGGCLACKEQGVMCLGRPALQVTARCPHPEAKKKKNARNSSALTFTF